MPLWCLCSSLMAGSAVLMLRTGTSLQLRSQITCIRSMAKFTTDHRYNIQLL